MFQFILIESLPVVDQTSVRLLEGISRAGKSFGNSVRPTKTLGSGSLDPNIVTHSELETLAVSQYENHPLNEAYGNMWQLH